MKHKNFVVLLLSSTLLAILMIGAVQANATEYEIAYDEGDAGTWFYFETLGSYAAVLFSVPTPPGVPTHLIRARFYLKNHNPDNPWPFQVIVFRADGITVLRDFQVLAPTVEKGWYDVDIRPSVRVDGDFYIAMQWITEPVGQVLLGVDLSPKDWRSYHGPPMTLEDGGWFTDMMIRAVVSERGYPFPTLSQWGLIILVILVAGSGVWLMVRKRRPVTG